MAISPKLTMNRKKNPITAGDTLSGIGRLLNLLMKTPWGLDELADLRERRGRENLNSEDLHTARGRAGTAADEHEEREDREREVSPG